METEPMQPTPPRADTETNAESAKGGDTGAHAAERQRRSLLRPARLCLVHELKTWPEYWLAVAEGRKTFEARQDDRGYEVGDVLLLRMWCPHEGRYTGPNMRRVVTYILRGPAFGVEAGWVVMAMGPEDAQPSDKLTRSARTAEPSPQNP